MSRSKKKETDVETNGTPEPQAAVAEPEAPAAEETQTQHTNGEKKRPIASWRVNSDRTTSIELSVWANTYTNQKGEDYEQLNLTVQRSYKDAQDQWQTQTKPSWRVHDLPILVWLIGKAHDFAMQRRANVEVPF